MKSSRSNRPRGHSHAAVDLPSGGLRNRFLLLLVLTITVSLSIGEVCADWPGSAIFIDGSQGLPQNSVRALLADHEDFLWVGTEMGLARFDGHRFIDYSSELPDIPRDVLFRLFEDSHGRIWTFWYRNNPRILMPDRSTVIEVQPAPGHPGDLRDGRPHLVEDAGGNVWFAGRNVIYRVTPEGTTTHVIANGAQISTGTALAGPVLIGNRLAFGSDQGLVLVDSTASRISARILPIPYTLASSADQAQRVSTVFELDGDVLACNERGVYEFNPSTIEFTPLFELPEGQLLACHPIRQQLLLSVETSPTAPMQLLGLDPARMSTGAAWPGLPDSGAVTGQFVDAAGDTWIIISSQVYFLPAGSENFMNIPVPTPFHGNVPPITQTPDGVVWIGTDGNGLARFSRFASKFLTTIPGQRNAAVSGQVRGMATDAQDNLWVGTEERGLLYWERTSNHWASYLRGSGTPIRQVAVLADGSVFASQPGLRKVLRFDPVQNRFVDFATGLSHTIGLLPYRGGQELILSGADESSILHYDPATDRMELFYDGAGLRSTESRIRAMAADNTGTVWFGTHGGGFGRVDSISQATFWHTGNSALGSDQVFALRFDDTGFLWIGTWHDGLWRFDPDTGDLRQFGPDSGQPLDTIFGILIDRQGALWLSGYRGLVRYRPCNSSAPCVGEATLFNQLDGLQDEEFDADAWFQSPRGEMFFGGVGGFNAFFPEDIELNPHQPELKITRVLKSGTPVPGISEHLDRLRLPNQFGDLRIEISTLDYHVPTKNRYQFRNLDAGEDWVDLADAGMTLRGWADGTHHLQFRGSNNDGLWSEPSKTLAIDIAPPPYRHPLMFLVYAVALILLPSLYYRWRQQNLTRQRALLEDQVARRTEALESALTARERFFANISHEIAAPLHMILLMLENNLDADMPDRRALYRSATGYAAQLMVYLRQLVNDARERETDRGLYALEPARLLQKLVEVNLPIAQSRNIQVDVKPMPGGHVGMNRTSAMSIFSNLLCNALVYTPEGGRITLAGERRNGIYRVTIENTTDLASEIDLDEVMERGSRGEFDPSRIGGHGLGLSIVTDALNALGGRLERMLREDGCVVFQVDLPVCEDDLPPLPETESLAFSHEQQLAIELVHSARPETPRGRNGKGRFRVLIIEDDEKVAQLLQFALGKDHDVTIASSCSMGIKLALAKLPQVILCDLFLPDASGFDLVKAVRTNRMTQDAFVVMLTASISEQDRRTGVSLGVDQFVTKPVSAETLRLMIVTHAQLIEQRKDNFQASRLRQKQLPGDRENGQTLFATAWPKVLDELYDDPDTTIEDFQNRLSMSYGALIKNCKNHFGSTPRRLLIERRIRAAQQLLENSDMQIGRIAETVGFASHSQFTVAFKRETGQGPADYRTAKAREARMGKKSGT